MGLGLGIFRGGFVVAALTVISGFAVPASAAGMKSAQVQPGIDCTCRYKGQDYQQGDMVCLNSPSGPQLARCGFVLNNTSWNFTGMGCLYSSAERHTPETADFSPPNALMTPISLQ